jgi:hypothetical protein
MLEDMLAYNSGTSPMDSFSELLEADLDEDARLFYARMVADIRIVTAGIDRLPHRGRLARMLLAALSAPPATRAASWRHLYREISALVAGRDPGTRIESPAFGAALGRLRAFLRENLDLADVVAVERFERAVVAQTVGA